MNKRLAHNINKLVENPLFSRLMGLFCSMRQNILYLLQFFIQFPLWFLVFLLLGCMIIFEFFPMVHVVLESSIVFYLISIIFLDNLCVALHKRSEDYQKTVHIGEQYDFREYFNSQSHF